MKNSFSRDPGDPLLEDRRIPRQVDVHHGVCGLEIEPRRPRVGREEESAGRIPLKRLNQRSPLRLRHLIAEVVPALPSLPWIHVRPHCWVTDTNETSWASNTSTGARVGVAALATMSISAPPDADPALGVA